MLPCRGSTNPSRPLAGLGLSRQGGQGGSVTGSSSWLLTTTMGLHSSLSGETLLPRQLQAKGSSSSCQQGLPAGWVEAQP